jgi:hypothetical protein
MRQDLQLRLHKITSKLALKCGSETWVLRAKVGRLLEAAQMRFLSSVFGVTQTENRKRGN